MRYHNFVARGSLDSARWHPDDLCEGCSLSWWDVIVQLKASNDFNSIDTDDCELRKRKNAMKAFW
jgi:hypothetical protein